MENSLIIPQDLVVDFPLKPHTLQFANDVVINSFNRDEDEDEDEDEDDIEMVALENKSYTSLKDLISESPPAMASPTNTSWREIPLKDPLVQHAAWAYLQPMAEARVDDGRWWRRLEEKCCGMFSCFNDVVLDYGA
ncbi:hypothetical protein BUALT_Bualt15G0005700 [Buddleja alternifolia]|uniref:Uncharacterized protein n=1 Tax=Buddleja alternifolia TaxID=168488 RepID=A0AAV6WJ99_9LAMI|nr:hypothetical protein BUALT_Bualt15G0005700 [Buddleja alternifolia]